MLNKKLNNFKIPMIIKHNEVTLTNHDDNDDEGKWKRWTINIVSPQYLNCFIFITIIYNSFSFNWVDVS